MLDEILDSGRLDVAFQPIVELATGDRIGFEVLGRARPAVAEPVPGPLELIAAAAEQGRLFDLERAWRRVAIEAIADLDRDGSNLFFLNVDTRIVADPRFRPGTTRALLERHGISPQRIVFELCERDSELGGPDVAELVPHYVAQGFGVAIDDLGMGHASLHAVLQLRPRCLKLGAELVSGLAGDPLRRHLIHALALFSVLADVELIAEGIETEADLMAVAKLGVPRPTLECAPYRSTWSEPWVEPFDRAFGA